MKQALIFYGGWDGHTPRETGYLFKDILEAEGFAVTITDSLDILSNYEEIAKFDLLVPMWTMGAIGYEQCLNVCRAVENGTGIAGCHGGMCDSFRESTDWQFLTGCQWVAHPGGEIDYTVELTPDTYFTQGLEGFPIHSEQYYVHVDPAVKAHAFTTFPTFPGPHAANGPVAVPVAYTKLWGAGRVYYNSLGHTYQVFEDIPAAREMMRRGFLWAVRGSEVVA